MADGRTHGSPTYRRCRVGGTLIVVARRWAYGVREETVKSFAPTIKAARGPGGPRSRRGLHRLRLKRLSDRGRPVTVARRRVKVAG
jgi:hypothetical protein